MHRSDETLQRLAESGVDDAHISTCEQCQAEWAAYRRLFARLGNLDQPEPPADFQTSVMQTIAARELGSWREIAGICALALFALWLVWPAQMAGQLWHRAAIVAKVVHLLHTAIYAMHGVSLAAAAVLLLISALTLIRAMKEERT